MKYMNDKGQTAEVISQHANADNKIRIQIDGEDGQTVVDYDAFIAEYRHIYQDNQNGAFK
ncbi:hypothetical protein ACFBZI_07580 [Moraxella sp. ZJ142]|uniref:hypothetical protein n=1 Tax=Moraxella marmotae TaxID=3344520 RepID=UPI0035D43DD9